MTKESNGERGKTDPIIWKIGNQDLHDFAEGESEETREAMVTLAMHRPKISTRINRRSFKLDKSGSMPEWQIAENEITAQNAQVFLKDLMGIELYIPTFYIHGGFSVNVTPEQLRLLAKQDFVKGIRPKIQTKPLDSKQ